jgi:hypothetical protein
LCDWEKAADEAVAVLHTAAGRDPDDRNVSDLVGELSAFRNRWAAHDVRKHSTGLKQVSEQPRRSIRRTDIDRRYSAGRRHERHP